MFFKLLIFTAALEFGFLNGGVFNYSPRNYEWTEIGALYATLEGRASLGPISVGGSVQTHFTPQTITNYVPFQATYIFDAKVKAGNVEIGYEHSCFHPIQPYAIVAGKEIKPAYEGGYNRIFVRIATK